MMRKATMPQARQMDMPQGLQWELSPLALDRWAPNLRAAAPQAADAASISMFDAIGADPWTGEGVTARMVSAVLRNIGATKDVTVNINSPGGDVFEGLAIYNLLREHKGTVTVKVLGLAASAASVIAMAGDEVQIARAGFLMIHNTWAVAIGNRNDMRAVADTLEPIDAAMSDIYSARSGMDAKKVSKMMDAETWINGSAAVDQGFADVLLPADAVKEDKAEARTERIAAHELEVIMARAGKSRTERSRIMNEIRAGKQIAADDDTTQIAGDEDTQIAVPDMVTALRSFSST
jgi:ATP-dependent protease ClpP protease subunit